MHIFILLNLDTYTDFVLGISVHAFFSPCLPESSLLSFFIPSPLFTHASHCAARRKRTIPSSKRILACASFCRSSSSCGREYACLRGEEEGWSWPLGPSLSLSPRTAMYVPKCTNRCPGRKVSSLTVPLSSQTGRVVPGRQPPGFPLPMSVPAWSEHPRPLLSMRCDSNIGAAREWSRGNKEKKRGRRSCGTNRAR